MNEPRPADGPLLFSPLRLRGIVARNRVVVSPMCQYASQEGGPTEWHLVHLGKFALGGAGIVFTEETAIAAGARKTHACAGIYNDAHVRQYRRITDFLRQNGAIPAIQLGHAGRKGSCGPPWTGFAPLTASDAEQGRPPWRTVAPSPLPPRPDAQVPVELSVDDIRANVAQWAEAARRSAEAGFEICEVHGAHGYLIHQFLSPVANRRTDGYGGSLEHRMRFALEVVEAVRAAWPSGLPLFFRVSAIDGAGGSWTIEDTVALSKALAERGVDVITCSSGGIEGPLNMAIVPRRPGYQVPFAARVKRDAPVMSCAVGLITEPEQAEAIVRRGEADLVALARELLYNPNWPVHAARALGHPQPLDLLPSDYGWWLKRREQVRALDGSTAETRS